MRQSSDEYSALVCGLDGTLLFMTPKVVRGIVFIALLVATVGTAAALERPVFRVDVPYPTKDKPQSKLWFARGSWWAWLPVRGGSSVWRRTDQGWQRQAHLDEALRGLPGQADVWADEDTATAVLVEPDRLAVAGLRWDSGAQRYEADKSPATFRTPPLKSKEGGIETATIARDGRGRWWIAYNFRRDMFVRHSIGNAAGEWSEPIMVNKSKASDDDICAIVALPDSVGVLWSDQEQDAVYFRRHDDRAAPGSWRAIETAEKGGKTADDHIHTAVSRDGRLYAATKNSLDSVGKPQQVLRVRDRRGKWTNYPYAMRTAERQPSRPIVLLGGNPEEIFLIHTLYHMDRAVPRVDVIAWQTSTLSRLDVTPAARILLDTGGRLNDVTGSKRHLPPGQVWIVLASDQAGNVYEMRLR